MNRPPAVVDRYRCTACGMWNDPKTTKSGGPYNPSYTTSTVGSTTVYTITDGKATGCAWCGCPDWRSGGSLGDMRR